MRTILFLLLAFLLFAGEVMKSFGEESRFLDHIDGTVTDRLTGLMWTKNADPADNAYNWFRALDAASQLNANKYCGYHDWRLPNVNELATLPDPHPFLHMASGIYWSSESNVQDPDYIWCVDLKNGRVDCYNKINHAEYVWGVRGSN